MEREYFLIAVVVTLSVLPLASALNCTAYEGDYYSLCNTINQTLLNESEKEKLMQPDIYESPSQETGTTDLTLNLDGEPQTTLETIYREDAGTIVKLLVFIFVNYGIFSILTKPESVIRWLTADS